MKALPGGVASPVRLQDERPAGGRLPPSDTARSCLPVPLVPVPEALPASACRTAQQRRLHSRRHAQNVNEALSTINWLHGEAGPDHPPGNGHNPMRAEVVDRADGLVSDMEPNGAPLKPEAALSKQLQVRLPMAGRSM
jgi:hypothetical protein